MTSTLLQKLEILAEAAKYDASCVSSGWCQVLCNQQGRVPRR